MDRSAEPLFPQQLLDALRAAPDRPAFSCGARTVTRAELLETVRRLAAGMRAAGLGRGRGVAIATSLSPEGFAANVAAHALGCRVVGVRPGWGVRQLADLLGTGTDALVVDQVTAAGLVELAGSATVLSLGTCDRAVDLLARPGGAPVTAEARPGDIARVNFTSGSTGRPKGCARTYRTFSLAYQPAAWPAELAELLTHFERFLAFGSWSLPVMLTFAGRCLQVGGTVVIPPEGDRARSGGQGGDGPALLPWAIERHRVTGTVTPVPMLRRMLDVLRTETVDIGSLRALVVTGSPAGPRLLAEAVDRLGPILWQGYGQGESGMISLLTPRDVARWPAAALLSVGRPLPDVEVSVRDADGRQVRPGRPGQIHVRGPHVMSGYWDDRRQTEEVLRDGWLDTRDLGYLDTRGLLHLTGRSRDVIMVNAQVCYAGPIERALAGHPDIDQAYVVGAPDERTGEAIHAFVVAREGRMPPYETLADLVRTELTAASVPTTITAISGVPVAASGKPDKSALLPDALRPAGGRDPGGPER